MESITTISGSVASICLKMFCVFVSVSMRQVLLFGWILSARILICFWLSSPETYKALYGNFKAIWSKRVLFPTPGSPPSNTKAPGTNPPPKTLLNSRSKVFNRTSFSMFISFTKSGVETLFEVCEGDFQFTFSSFCTTSSTTVFHCLQAEHWPTHLAYCVPQFWQKNAVFVLAIFSFYWKS